MGDSRLVRVFEVIEARLDEPLDVQALAQVACMSPFHFHRVFGASVGMEVMRYVRGRRLTRAAEMLQEPGQSLVGVALECGYGSQSAFTRAFRRWFGVSPGRFREEDPAWMMMRRVDRLDAQALERRMALVKGPERIVEFEGCVVEGMSGTFAPMDPKIPALWGKFLQSSGGASQGRRSFGICASLTTCPDEVQQEGRFWYMASHEAEGEESPEGLERFEIPPGTYAVFTHRGPISRLGETVKDIWGVWVSRTALKLRQAPDFELYDERFKGDAPDSELDIYIPVHRAE